MYKKFRLKNFKEEFLQEEKYKEYLQKGKNNYEKNKEEIKRKLENYLNYENELDGNKIIEEWFKDGEYDVFLSHSHQDEELAIAIAGILDEKFGLKVFIDSQVWGYVNDLLKDIDNKYCKKLKKENTYDYDKRNISTSHVHSMLNTAIAKMIDSCDNFFFLDSPSSLKYNSNIFQDLRDVTYSPYIKFEIEVSNYIRRKFPKNNNNNINFYLENVNNQPVISYQLLFEKFISLDYKTFSEISNSKPSEFLEEIYKLKEEI